jgi:opacity protein-like surface antigen
MKKLLFILFLILAFAFSASAEDVERAARFNINGRTGDDFIGQAGILYPIRSEENSLWYTDLRYRMSEDDVDEWNFGLGYRYKQDNAKNHIAGAYLFRDRREEYDHYWDMWTVGGEILTDQWDFRINGYIADNDKTLAPDAVVGGNSVEVNNNRELVLVLGNEVYYTAMDGLDIEVGKRFTETDSIFKNVGVYAKLYRFFESDTPTITGRQIRVDKKFGDINNINWSIGARWRDDNIRESETEATFAVSIPFGKGSAAGKDIKDVSPEDIIEARMTEQPERDLDVVVGKSVSENAAAGQEIIIKNPALEESLKVWYVTENGNYDALGTKDDPVNLARIIDAEKGAKEGEIIVLSGRDGDIYLDFENINNVSVAEEPIYRIILKDYQKLISKRGYALVEAEVEGELKEFQFKPDVEQATLVGARYKYGMINPTSNNVISGINFRNEFSDSYAYSSIIYGYDMISGDLNINNNIFTFDSEEIGSLYGIIISPNYFSSDETINISNNTFNNLLKANGQEIPIVIHENHEKTKINISDNILNGFDSSLSVESGAVSEGVIIENLYKENMPTIKNNRIKNFDYAINLMKDGTYQLDDSGSVFTLVELGEISKMYIEEMGNDFINIHGMNENNDEYKVYFGFINEDR